MHYGKNLTPGCGEVEIGYARRKGHDGAVCKRVVNLLRDGVLGQETIQDAYTLDGV